VVDQQQPDDAAPDESAPARDQPRDEEPQADPEDEGAIDEGDDLVLPQSPREATEVVRRIAEEPEDVGVQEALDGLPPPLAEVGVGRVRVAGLGDDRTLSSGGAEGEDDPFHQTVALERLVGGKPVEAEGDPLPGQEVADHRRGDDLLADAS
jgi:hypothetical protein